MRNLLGDVGEDLFFASEEDKAGEQHDGGAERTDG